MTIELVPSGDVIPEPVRPGYCTDEDIALETSDFAILTPSDALVAVGTDGSLDPAAPWCLRSATVNFHERHVRPGMVIYLSRPESVFGAEPGDSLAIEGIHPSDDHALLLRRKEMDFGVGSPPGGGVATILNVQFEIRSLLGMIEKTARDIDEELGIAKILRDHPGEAISDDDIKLLSDINVYKVLSRRYLAMSRGTPIPGAKEGMMEKSLHYDRLAAAAMARLDLNVQSGESVRRPTRWTRITK